LIRPTLFTYYGRHQMNYESLYNVMQKHRSRQNDIIKVLIIMKEDNNE
jgi:hypothetical protein